MKLKFSRKIFAKYSVTIFVKILPARAELFHANEQRDIRHYMTKLIVAFHNSAEAHKKRETQLVVLSTNIYGQP